MPTDENATQTLASPRHRDVFENLGRTLMLCRTLLGLSQAELGKRTGIRANQLSRYEMGHVKPQLEQLGRLLEALEIRPVDFFLMMARVERMVSALEKSRAFTVGDLRDELALRWETFGAAELELSERFEEIAVELFERRPLHGQSEER